MKLTEFYQKLDDAIPDGQSTFDIEVSIIPVHDTDSVYFLLYSIDTGKEVGRFII